MQLAPIDPPEIEAALWHDFEGEVGWDIGANGGQSLKHMLARFDHVVAFEPAEECQEHLDGWTASFPDRITVCPIAVSDVDGTVDLLAVPDKISTGQLVTAEIKDMEWDAENPDGFIRPVPCRTIDTLIETTSRPDFIKIDVEGHELAVLHGASRLLAEAPPDMLIEFHSKDLHERCTDLLVAAGYGVFTVRHPHYHANSDFWFTHGWIRCFAPVKANR